MTLKYFLLGITIIIASFFAECSSKESREVASCSVDEVFVLNYENCLSILFNARKGTSVDFKDRFRAIECIEAITEMESNIIKFSDVPYLLYNQNPSRPDQDLFDTDIDRWALWLKENKCNFDMNDASHAFALRSQRLGTQLNWPSL